MPRYDAIQNSFSGGEVSPRLRGRTDIDLYKKALALCEGWRPLPQGSLLMRGGTEHISSMPSSGRLIRFRAAQLRQYAIFLGAGTIRIYTVSGDSYSSVKVKGLERFASPMAVPPWSIVATSPFGGPTLATAYGRSAWTSSAGGRVRGSTTATETGVHDLVLDCFGNVHVRVGTTPGGTELLDVSISAARTVQVNLTAGQTIYVDAEVVTGQMTFFVPSLRSVSSTVPMVSPWSVEQAAEVQYVEVPGESRILFFHETAHYVLKRNAEDDWSFIAIAYNGAPDEWATGPKPGAADIYQGRLFLAMGNRVWASRAAGDLFDLRTATGELVNGVPSPVPADGLDFKIATKGSIQWLRGSRTLLAGTDLGLLSVFASGGLLMPGDVQSREETAHGAAPVQAVNAGSLTLYVSSDRRKVLAADFDYRNDGWGVKDVTFVADHITKGGISELHFAPESGTIMLLLQTGAVVFCSFDPEQGIAAWWRAPIAAGTIESGITQPPSPVRAACIGNDAVGESAWMIVQRSTGFHLERMPLYDGDVPFLDSYITAQMMGGSVIGGLSHLAPFKVCVVINGALITESPVDVDGYVHLPEPLTEVCTAYVGLRHNPKAKLLKLEGGNPAGTAQAHTVAWSEVVTRLNDSVLPKVNGQRPRERSQSTPGDTAEPRVTGDAGVRGVNGDIEITQDVPLRTEVCAVFGTASLGKV